MAAIEAVGVGEKSHEDMVTVVDIFECRGHGVRSKLCGRELATSFHAVTASPSLAYSEVSVISLDALGLEILSVRLK